MKIVDLISQPEKKNKHVLKMLLMHYLHFTKEELVTKDQTEIDSDVLVTIERDYNRFVIDKEPLEYILGYVEFDQRRLYVDQNTMIPRPETEYMIEACKEQIASLSGLSKKGRNIITDVGTGCGVLGLSTFLSNTSWCDQLFLCDYYPECLKVSKKNMNNLVDVTEQNKIEFAHANLLAHMFDNDLVHKEDTWLVTANLPYIPTELFDNNAEENVHKWEPRYAFISGKDGLDLYREMFAQIKAYTDMPKDFFMYLEMMTWQVEILREEFPWLEFEEVKTFHFQIRIVKAWLK